jgi:four helix bundle protein
VKYERFEVLPVWNDAIEMKLMIDEFIKQPEVAHQRNLVAHLDEAGLSVSNNIAEGFERGTTNELLYFLYISRGSAGEVRSMLRYLERRADCSHLRSQISNLISKAESISRQLRGWADSLQNSDIKGQRHLTDQTRAHYDQDKRARAFAAKIKSEHEARIARWSQGITDRPASDKKEDEKPA